MICFKIFRSTWPTLSVCKSVVLSPKLIHARDCHLSSFFNNFESLSKCFYSYTGGIRGSRTFPQVMKDDEQRMIIEKECVEKLVIALQCAPEEAKILVIREPGIYINEIEDVLKRIDFLKRKQIPVRSILRDVWILHMNKTDLISYFSLMKNWGLEEKHYHECLLFFKMKFEDFFAITEAFRREKSKVPYDNRLVYLAKFLNCSIRDISERLLAYPMLLRRKFDFIQSSLNTYKKFGIEEKDILSDISCIRCSSERITERLTIAQVKKLENIKPWMARWCTKNFEKYIQLHEGEIELLAPYTTRKEFLCGKLQLSKRELNNLGRKHPFILIGNAKKLAGKINFLLSAGYTPQDILFHIQILTAGLELMKTRHQELQQLGIRKPSIQLLNISKKAFEAFAAHLTSSKDVIC